MDDESKPTRDLASLGHSDQQSRPPTAPKLSPAREAVFVAVICLAQFLMQAGLGSVLAILPILTASLGITNRGVSVWLIAGYSLTVGSFILVSGRLGDLYGHRRVLLVGYAWFGAFSVVAGLAVYSPGSVLFVFARVLSGIGPSLMLPNALAILGITYPPSPRKDLVFSLFGAVAPGGCIVGAALAGVFALAWWPWFFWAMGIALLVTAGLGYLVIPEDDPRVLLSRRSTKSSLSALREFFEAVDALGGVVGVTALVLVNFAWNQAGVVGWSEPYVYVLMIVGVLLVPAFFWIELRVVRSPLLPFDVLNGKVGAVLVCIACGWGSFGIWVFYIFQFFEHIRGASPLLATAWLSPVAMTGALASLTTAYLLGRAQPATIMVIAMTAFTVGSIIIATAPADQTYWGQSFVVSLVIPFGMDMSFPAASLIISNAVPREKQGVGMSLVNTVVNYSISIALGIAGTVEMQVTKGDVGPGAALRGYRSAWYFGIGLAGLGLCFSVVNLVITKIRVGLKLRG
ncbi:MAG: hypothetical protein M1822_006873 [Bathelium mastoideum]|nr:MAG: hypothetical protein M1822_006873 [Bathelium mastoideum]